MYENEFEFNNEFYSSTLDEMYSYEIDDEYARVTYDVQELAYRHYA